MNDEVKNFRSIRTDDNFFVEKALVIFDFFLKFINVHVLTIDRAIFFELFFSKLDDDRTNQKRLKKINAAINQISRTRSFWLSFIEAKTTTAWKKVELLRKESIFKSKDLDCLYCAKQRLKCTHVLDIACTACNKKKNECVLILRLLCRVSRQLRQIKNRVDFEELKTKIWDRESARFKSTTDVWKRERERWIDVKKVSNLERETHEVHETVIHVFSNIVASLRMIVELSFFFELKLQLFFRNFYK